MATCLISCLPCTCLPLLDCLHALFLKTPLPGGAGRQRDEEAVRTYRRWASFGGPEGTWGGQTLMLPRTHARAALPWRWPIRA